MLSVGASTTIKVVDGVLMDVMTTVTGLLLVTPFGTALCVTTEVTMFVVGSGAEAEMIDVTTFVWPSTVVVESSACRACEIVDRLSEDDDGADRMVLWRVEVAVCERIYRAMERLIEAQEVRDSDEPMCEAILKTNHSSGRV